MIDTHAHILPGIDDGAKDILESIEMAKKAKNAGFNGIVCTSHYLRHNSEFIKEDIKKNFDNFKNELLKNNIDIDLYLGNEVYVDDEITDLITSNSFYAINNSKYILIELPMNHKIHHLDDIIFKIQNLDLNPIIAHPERYSYVQDNPNMLVHLIENGVLFQANFREFNWYIW